MKKQNQHDDYKENILENQDKFDILTKDLVCNIEKRVLKRTNKKLECSNINLLLPLMCIILLK